MQNIYIIKIIKKLLLIVIFQLAFVPSLFSGTVQLHKLSNKIFVTPHLEYLEDKNGSLTIDDIKSKKYDNHWISSDKGTLTFGYTDSVYWFRFVIQNGTSNDIEYFLEHSFPTVDNIKLYIYNQGNSRVIETGDTRPFSSRGYNYRNFVFPLKSKAKSSTSFYVRQSTNDSMIIRLTLHSPEAFREMELMEYSFLAMFYGILLIMIIYNFIIFTFLRRIEYLYYVLFIICAMLLAMIVNGTAYQFLWPDSPGWANYSLPLFLFIVQIFLSLFAMELVEIRTGRDRMLYRQIAYKITLGYCLLIIITIMALTVFSWRHPTRIAVSSFGIVIALILLNSVVLIVIERNRAAIIGLFAGLSTMLGGIAVILMSLGILPSNFFVEWSIYIGSVFTVALFSFALADRINTMTKIITLAEKKYRELVESSDDIIFSLDENLNFLSVNKAIRKHLGYFEQNIIGKNIFDFIHDSDQISKHINREVIEGYAENLRKTQKGVSFRTDFKKRHTQEPVELFVKLEYAESEDRKEKILGKASPRTDDTILKYMKLEKNIYEAENYLNNAELLSQRLTQNLYRFLDKSKVSAIRLSLREILINAIEHGNLDINFEEKTNAMVEGNYLKYILSRQGDPLYKDRKIHVDYLLNENSVTYTITDEGKGFDYQNFEDFISKKSNVELLPHGRGLIMVRNTFDDLEFNEKGNQVKLVKFFNE